MSELRRSEDLSVFDKGSQYDSDHISSGELREPSVHQIALPFVTTVASLKDEAHYRDHLIQVLGNDMDFHGEDTSYASHNFHSFPAKFPPQVPRRLLEVLTRPGDVVLDPMMGSGTTIVEAYLTDREAWGTDLDPLALLLTKVKTTHLDADEIFEISERIARDAYNEIERHQDSLLDQLEFRWDKKTHKFVDYWFAQETQLELIALIREIERIDDESIKAFFELAFSSCIITKSGGVSLALDLAHTRPHRAKLIYKTSGEILYGQELLEEAPPRLKYVSKHLRSALVEFRKRVRQNANSLIELELDRTPPQLKAADAQNLPFEDASVDLVVTSPPYASNAIDYMRAHKFSLVWLGHSIDELGITRGKYIGGEATASFEYVELPQVVVAKIAAVAALDASKAKVLYRYYSEMMRVLKEMNRVLKPNRASILVVASSSMRGVDTATDTCLTSIGRSIGFEIPSIGVRKLDRNRRMLPAGLVVNTESQIQQRMHQEYIIGFYKPY